jgi:plasminogen activator inhibitor 1 RNA-binding protein
MSQNRFSVLLGGGDDDQELDKLGNTKPSENKQEPPRSRRTIQPAVSPPSRHFRGRKSETFDEPPKRNNDNNERKPNDTIKGSQNTNKFGTGEKPRGRPFDRHSAAAYDVQGTKKKNNQSWGNPVSSELAGATDKLFPNDPDAAEPMNEQTTEEADNTMTLEEYKAKHQNSSLSKKNETNIRAPNDGLEDDSWKNNIIHRSENDDYYSGKGATSKARIRNKKEKVFLDIDPPKHQPNNRGRGNRRRGNGRNNNSKTRFNEQLNLSDNTVFPTLG